MRRVVTLSVLGLVFLFTSGQSGCEDKGTTTNMLLTQGRVFSKDPIPEQLYFSQDWPGVKNPNIGDYDTEWDISYRPQLTLGQLWAFQLSQLIARAYDDSGPSQVLVASKIVSVSGTDTQALSLSLSEILDEAGYTSETPEELRIRIGAMGSLFLGNKKTIRKKRDLFRKGGEPYLPGVGQLSAVAVTSRVVMQSDGSIVSESWWHYPVFADLAYEIPF